MSEYECVAKGPLKIKGDSGIKKKKKKKDKKKLLDQVSKIVESVESEEKKPQNEFELTKAEIAFIKQQEKMQEERIKKKASMTHKQRVEEFNKHLDSLTEHFDIPKTIKTECQVDKNEHFRHLLLFAFNQGFKAAKAARDICAVYGEGAISGRAAQIWYAKFKSGNFDLKDAPRSGRPVELDENRLNEVLNENPCQTTRQLAEKMGCSHSTIETHLQAMRMVQQCGAWVSCD